MNGVKNRYVASISERRNISERRKYTLFSISLGISLGEFPNL